MSEKELLLKMNFEREELAQSIRDCLETRRPKLTQRKICEDLSVQYSKETGKNWKFYPQNFNAFLNGRAKLSFQKVKMIVDYLGM